MSVFASAPGMLRSGSVMLKVTVNTPDSSPKSVTITVVDSQPGLIISPADTTVTAPGEATIRVTAPAYATRGEIHVLKVRARASGLDDAEQSVTLYVDPIPLFLPLVVRK